MPLNLEVLQCQSASLPGTQVFWSANQSSQQLHSQYHMVMQ
jgi:hypothetical protein